MPPSILQSVTMFRYRERLHLSYQQLEDEPVEEIRRAILIWSLDDRRVKLEEARQQMRQESQQASAES